MASKTGRLKRRILSTSDSDDDLLLLEESTGEQEQHARDGKGKVEPASKVSRTLRVGDGDEDEDEDSEEDDDLIIDDEDDDNVDDNDDNEDEEEAPISSDSVSSILPRHDHDRSRPDGLEFIPPPQPRSFMWAIIRADNAVGLRAVICAAAMRNTLKSSTLPSPSPSPAPAASSTTGSGIRIGLSDILYYAAAVGASSCTALLLDMDYRPSALRLMATAKSKQEREQGQEQGQKPAREEDSDANPLGILRHEACLATEVSGTDVQGGPLLLLLPNLLTASLVAHIAANVVLAPETILALRKGRRVVGSLSDRGEAEVEVEVEGRSALGKARAELAYTPLLAALFPPTAAGTVAVAGAVGAGAGAGAAADTAQAPHMDVVVLYCKKCPRHCMVVLRSAVDAYSSRRRSTAPPVLFELVTQRRFWEVLSVLAALDEGLCQLGSVKTSATAREDKDKGRGQGEGTGKLRSDELRLLLERTTLRDGRTLLHWAAAVDDNDNDDDYDDDADDGDGLAPAPAPVSARSEEIGTDPVGGYGSVAPSSGQQRQRHRQRQTAISTAMFVEQVALMVPSLVAAQTLRGLSPLHYAALASGSGSGSDGKGNGGISGSGGVETPPALLALLRCGADPMATDEQGWTPFLYALLAERVPSAMALLDITPGQRQRHAPTPLPPSLSGYSRVGGAVKQLRVLGSLINQTAAEEEEEENEEEEEEEEGPHSHSHSHSRSSGATAVHRGMDRRVQKMLAALGTVHEFRSLLNEVLRENLSLLDEELAFLLAYPSLINLDNKLAIAKKAITLLSEEAQSAAKIRGVGTEGNAHYYPCFDSKLGGNFGDGYSSTKVYLSRGNPWGELVDLLLGRRDCSGKSRNTPSLSSATQKRSAPAPAAASPSHSAATQSYVRPPYVSAAAGARTGAASTAQQAAATGGPYFNQSKSSGPSPSPSPNLSAASSPAQLAWAAQLLRSSLLFQYKEEVGFGKGVERELLEAVTKDMLYPSPSCVFVCREDAAAAKTEGEGEGGGASGAAGVYYPLPLSSRGSGSSSSSSSSSGSSGGGNWQQQQLSQKYQKRYDGLLACGRLLGHLLLRRMDNTLTSLSASSLGINISLCLWKVLLKKKTSLDDLAAEDANMSQSLRWMLDAANATELESLDMCFTAPAEEDYDMDAHLAATQSGNSLSKRSGSGSGSGGSGGSGSGEVDLKNGGSRIRVTAANVREYVHLLTQHLTAGRVRAQADVLREGLLSVVPSMVLSLFSEQDLSLLVAGDTGAGIDVGNWRRYADVGNAHSSSFSPSSSSSKGSWNNSQDTRILEWFWRMVAALTDTERGLLLRFSTGSSRAPIGGFQQLKPRFNIALTPYSADTSLPTAATCFNMLKLPRYPSERLLRKNILVAITYGSEGFSFS